MFLLLSSIVLTLLLLVALSKNRKPFYDGHSLPPAPWPHLPLVGSLFCHPPTMASLVVVLRRLHAAHGPVVSLWVGSKPAIFITCHDIAHRALVHMGTTFAHRPATWSSGLNSHGVNSATYGNRWGLLRRNLSSHLATAHVTGVLRSSTDKLVKNLESASAGEDDGVVVAPSETFRHAVFGFFAALCFGEGVGEDTLRRLRGLHAEIIPLIVELDAFHLMPVFLQVVCYFPRWRKLLSAQRRHHVLVTTMISACRRRREEGVGPDVAQPRCYVVTLLGLGLGEDEMVSLCWEYMNASVKTTTTELEWIMARLVLHQDIQQKLRKDIASRRASGNHTMTCGGRRRRPFVEAVVLEALRLHPPAHYLLAHTTDKDVTLDNYMIPKGSIVNFSVASIGRDATLWTDPDVFRPERFVEGGEGSGVRCTTGGSDSGPETMKMIPFGAGRRACPGAGIAMTVLQSFVEDLVRRFDWIPVASGVEASIDMAEKPGIITEMRVPLRARLVTVRQNDVLL
ncbi:Cytochrome P450 89A9 [Dichanthelium oligosanthes]|uniref:Cytochrome P450 89A9 n=1 Tax=Dichanthelium oligosanthes TaxID=888268 RepID=A0A1E5VRD2_9POAL|nr:Cytochrome P450 89A9 [Dichanthelium oligosanthes]